MILLLNRFVYFILTLDQVVWSNGFISESFPVTRSVRQGCSLSFLLYVLCVEALAVSVKLDPHISGVKLPGQQQDK